jgi:hypothetical protein
MTDEYPRHAPPEVLDTLQELISKNSPGEIGALFIQHFVRLSRNRMINGKIT